MTSARPTSARKRAANRANARNSTGPRTTAGKARVARNACRHGLGRPVGRDSALAAEVAGLARAILADPMCRSGDEQGAAGVAAASAPRAPAVHLAHRIAEVEVDLRRVRRRRNAAIARAIADRARHGDLVDELARFDRYEHRARSRRRFAIREFDEALLGASQGLRQAVSRCVADVALVARACVPAKQSHRSGAAAFRQNKATDPEPAGGQDARAPGTRGGGGRISLGSREALPHREAVP